MSYGWDNYVKNKSSSFIIFGSFTARYSGKRRWFPIGFNSALDKIGMDVKTNKKKKKKQQSAELLFSPGYGIHVHVKSEFAIATESILNQQASRSFITAKIIYNLDYFSCRNIQQWNVQVICCRRRDISKN